MYYHFMQDLSEVSGIDYYISLVIMTAIMNDTNISWHQPRTEVPSWTST